jgi:hypothetical protein
MSFASGNFVRRKVKTGFSAAKNVARFTPTTRMWIARAVRNAGS